MCKGIYQFLHMAFSLEISQDISRMWMEQTTNRLTGVISTHDDICVHRKTTQEHNENVICLMQTATKNNFVFDSKKCRIIHFKMTSYSAVFTKYNMKSAPTRVQIYKTFSPPPKSNQIAVILGLIDYLQVFISGLSDKEVFLRE